jgi:hypothetical protein
MFLVIGASQNVTVSSPQCLRTAGNFILSVTKYKVLN